MRPFLCQTRPERVLVQLKNALISVRYAIDMEVRKSVLEFTINEARVADDVAKKYMLERYRLCGNAGAASKIKGKNDKKRGASARRS